MARLGVDATSVAPDGKGISRVQLRTVEALHELGRHELVVFARHPELIRGSIPVVERPALRWEQRGMPGAFERHRLDAMLTWTERLPLVGGGRYLVWLFEPPTYRIAQNRRSGASAYQRASDLVTLALWRRSLRRAAFVFAASQATANVLEREAVVLPPGVDAEFVPAEGPARDYVLAILSGDPREGAETTLRVFRAVRDAMFPAGRLLVAGGFRGPRERAVEYLGRVSDERLVELYQNAAVYLDTSSYEGFGFQPLEALACATPVVAMEVTSIPEVVDGGGVLCPPGDTACLATQLARLLQHRDEAARLGERGRRHAAAYRWDRVAGAISAAVAEVVS